VCPLSGIQSSILRTKSRNEALLSPSKRVADVSNETSGTSNEFFKVPSALKYLHEVSDLCKNSRGGGPSMATIEARCVPLHRSPSGSRVLNRNLFSNSGQIYLWTSAGYFLVYTYFKTHHGSDVPDVNFIGPWDLQDHLRCSVWVWLYVVCIRLLAKASLTEVTEDRKTVVFGP
jgi:hypothetical protein